MKKNLLVINKYYSKAWKLIQDNDIDSATKVIYNDLSMKLYDLSLDILDFKRKLNPDEPDFQLKALFEKTRHLIQKVDKKLYEISEMSLKELKQLEEQQLSELEEDKFNNNEF